jgi:ubiquinone biosynthesis protein
MGRSLASDFDFLEFSMEFANQIIKAKIDIDKLKDQALTVARDYNSLSTMLPQNLKHFLRKINSPNFNFKMSVLEMSSLNQQLKKSSVTIHNGLVASALIIAGSVVFDSPSQSLFHGIPLLSLGCFGLAFIISFSIFFR